MDETAVLDLFKSKCLQDFVEESFLRKRVCDLEDKDLCQHRDLHRSMLEVFRSRKMLFYANMTNTWELPFEEASMFYDEFVGKLRKVYADNIKEIISEKKTPPTAFFRDWLVTPTKQEIQSSTNDVEVFLPKLDQKETCVIFSATHEYITQCLPFMLSFLKSKLNDFCILIASPFSQRGLCNKALSLVDTKDVSVKLCFVKSKKETDTKGHGFIASLRYHTLFKLGEFEASKFEKVFISDFDVLLNFEKMESFLSKDKSCVLTSWHSQSGVFTNLEDRLTTFQDCNLKIMHPHAEILAGGSLFRMGGDTFPFLKHMKASFEASLLLNPGYGSDQMSLDTAYCTGGPLTKAVSFCKESYLFKPNGCVASFQGASKFDDMRSFFEENTSYLK